MNDAPWESYMGACSAEIESDPDVAVVMACYAAFARGDVDEAIAPLHPDVEWVEPDEFPNGGRRHGPAAVAEYLRESRAMWADLISEPAARRRSDKIVIVHHVSGRLVDGRIHDNTVADVFTVKKGRIVSMHAYADPARALALSS